MKLVIIIHGWLLSAKDLSPLIRLLRQDSDFQDTEFQNFTYDSSKFSNQRLNDVSAQFAETIQGEAATNKYSEIVVVGHSIGGLIARRTFLLLLGNDEVCPVPVTKIVLIGTPNRGSTLTQYNLFERGWMHLMEVVDQMRLIRDAVRGSKFITNLRLDWVREFRGREDAGIDSARLPHIVQLTCQKDFRVNKKDSLDVTQFGNAEYVEIANESHESVIQVTDRSEEKYQVIKSAILSPRPPQGNSGYRGTIDSQITKIIILLHGIRTNAAWTREAAAVLKRDGVDGSERADIIVLAPNYGYFSIAKFLWPISRNARVFWFRDEYSEAFVEHPWASFSFVGHSNGTYILANSLSEFNAIRFDRVYFAGSVVPRGFEWSRYFATEQVKYLRNDCAAIDLPVGILCNALHHLGVKKLGVGGFTGFDETSERIFQNRYLKVSPPDGHSDALNAANFETVKRFILDSNPRLSFAPATTLIDRPPGLMNHLFLHSRFYFLFALALITLGGGCLWVTYPLACVAYIIGVLWLLWRF